MPLVRFKSDELEALQMRLQNRDLDARRLEALRRAQFKLDAPNKLTSYGKPKSKQRIEDPDYLTFIRTQPCLICQTHYRVEAAHTGWHGTAQRTEDRSCVPLCHSHHQSAKDSYHKLRPEARFERTHGVSLAREVARLQAAWEKTRRTWHHWHV